MQFLTQKELKKLFRVIEKDTSPFAARNLAIIHIAYYCGLRASEIGLFYVSRFNPQRNELYCERQKGSISNTLPLDDRRTKVIKQHINHNKLTGQDTLFESKHKKPISRRMLDTLMKDYCKRAKIDSSKAHFHVLKHSCVVHMLESGIDFYQVNQWVGHKKIENTVKYGAFTGKMKTGTRDSIERNPEFVK